MTPSVSTDINIQTKIKVYHYNANEISNAGFNINKNLLMKYAMEINYIIVLVFILTLIATGDIYGRINVSSYIMSYNVNHFRRDLIENNKFLKT